MGQGGGGDKPNRGGDRDGARRKADDEAAAEAERVVQNALDEARDARQHSPESRSARIIRDRALSEPPGRMVMPVKRGTTDPKRVTAGQIEYDINNLEFVENSGVRGAYYYGLRDEEFKTAVSQIEAVCETENNSTATNNVVKRMRGWKHGSGDRSAQTHESTFKQALDIEAPIRDVADGPAEVSDEEIAAAHELHEFTTSFLREHVGEQFETYRGLGYSLPDTARELFDSPENNQYALDGVSVLSNYTLDNQLAAEYSKIAVEKATSPDDIAVSSDLLVRDRDADGNLITEAEVRMRGDRVSSVPSNRLVVAETGQELAEVVTSVPDSERVAQQMQNRSAIRAGEREQVLSRTQHEAIKQCVEGMVTEDESRAVLDSVRVRTADAKDRLERWLLLYRAETDGEGWRRLRRKVAEITREVE